MRGKGTNDKVEDGWAAVRAHGVRGNGFAMIPVATALFSPGALSMLKEQSRWVAGLYHLETVPRVVS